MLDNFLYKVLKNKNPVNRSTLFCWIVVSSFIGGVLIVLSFNFSFWLILYSCVFVIWSSILNFMIYPKEWEL